MLEVRDKRRANLYHQCLELCILRARYKRVVERVQYGLMVRDFAVDVGAVEVRSSRCLQCSCRLHSARVELLAGPVVRRRDADAWRTLVIACDRLQPRTNYRVAYSVLISSASGCAAKPITFRLLLLVTAPTGHANRSSLPLSHSAEPSVY